MIVTKNKFAIGGFSDVIFDEENKMVYKIFKSFLHPSADRDNLDEFGYITYMQRVFKSEMDAYLIISEQELKKYFPVYYPDIAISKVIDLDESDISAHYLLDCCLCLEYIRGDFFKWNQYDDEMLLRDYLFNREEVFNNLNQYGVAFTVDCSLAINGASVKLIDVATTDFDCLRPQ